MYLLNENELDKLELTELSALYYSFCSAKSFVTSSENANPVFIANQVSLLNMMISQVRDYAIVHNYLITDDNLIIRNNSHSKKGN